MPSYVKDANAIVMVYDITSRLIKKKLFMIFFLDSESFEKI